MSSSRRPSSSHAVVSHGCHVCVRWVPTAMRRWGYTSVCHNNHDFPSGKYILSPLFSHQAMCEYHHVLSPPSLLGMLSVVSNSLFAKKFSRRGDGAQENWFSSHTWIWFSRPNCGPPRLDSVRQRLTVPDCRFSGVSPVFFHTPCRLTEDSRLFHMR